MQVRGGAVVAVVMVLGGGAAGGAWAADAVPAPAPPAAQEVIYSGEATSILGRVVNGPEDKPVGRIIDVLVDDAGQPRAAVIDVGGFMGIGNRHVAVAWRALRFAATTKGPGEISIDMTAAQIAGTPEFEHVGKPVTVAAPPVPAPGEGGEAGGAAGETGAGGATTGGAAAGETGTGGAGTGEAGKGETGKGETGKSETGTGSGAR